MLSSLTKGTGNHTILWLKTGEADSSSHGCSLPAPRTCGTCAATQPIHDGDPETDLRDGPRLQPVESEGIQPPEGGEEVRSRLPEIPRDGEDLDGGIPLRVCRREERKESRSPAR